MTDDKTESYRAMDAYLADLCATMERELHMHAGSTLVTMERGDLKQVLGVVRMYRTHLGVAQRAQEVKS